METNYIQISYGQLALATLFIVVNIGLSFSLRLGLERSLGIASLRMVIQLLLVGYILQWVFTLSNPILIIVLALGMTCIAGVSSVNRTRRRFPSIYWNNFISLLSGSFLVTGIIVSGILRVQPWYEPQYLIPLLGMVLGNALTGTSLSLDRLNPNDAIRYQIVIIFAQAAGVAIATMGVVILAFLVLFNLNHQLTHLLRK
ncbi:ABC transporter permease [Pelatocladus sp. BLCC-F211]|uniref:ABC transporter permease n=1 Tax=Pelatocladus sp. BLCC-F211 TaxID=3342752 RepID=UPI0035B9EFD2